MVAAATILPVSASGLTIFSLGGGQVIVALVGWFTGPSAAESTDGLFVATRPARLADTRTVPGRIWAGGTIEIPSPVTASALVTNVTAAAPDWRGFITAYSAGTPLPATSAVNPIEFEHTVHNFAITPISTRGAAYYSLAGVDLVLDLTGYFTGQPVDAPLPPAASEPRVPRVLIVGDSAMAALNVYTDAVVLAEWSTYSASHSRQWFWDGTHMYRAGAYGQVDYLSRWIAALTHQPCPEPWMTGGEIFEPCPVPDGIGAPSDPQSLY